MDDFYLCNVSTLVQKFPKYFPFRKQSVFGSQKISSQYLMTPGPESLLTISRCDFKQTEKKLHGKGSNIFFLNLLSHDGLVWRLSLIFDNLVNIKASICHEGPKYSWV